MEGALLRLRPKVMTVSTVVAGLLPIMWSTRTGAEVMKPLATPVLGGMISSLLHVLIVTPVIFMWLREREIKRDEVAGAPNALGTLDTTRERQTNLEAQEGLAAEAQERNREVSATGEDKVEDHELVKG